MGVLGITPFLKKTCPHVFTRLPDRLRSLRGKTVVIDGTLVTQRLHFAPMPHPHRHVIGWHRILTELRDADVRAICVFDGKQRSAAKAREVQRRRQSRKIDAVRGSIETTRLHRLQKLMRLLPYYRSLPSTDRQRINDALSSIRSACGSLDAHVSGSTLFASTSLPSSPWARVTSHPDHPLPPSHSYFFPPGGMGSHDLQEVLGSVPASPLSSRSEPPPHLDTASHVITDDESDPHDILSTLPFVHWNTAVQSTPTASLPPPDSIESCQSELSILYSEYSQCITQLTFMPSSFEGSEIPEQEHDCAMPADTLDTLDARSEIREQEHDPAGPTGSHDALDVEPEIPEQEQDRLADSPDTLEIPEQDHDPTSPADIPDTLDAGIDYAMSKQQLQMTFDEGHIWHLFSKPSPDDPLLDTEFALATLAERSTLISRSYQRRANEPTAQTYKECRELLRAMGVPCIESPGPFEAEALACALVTHGHADYVVSEDTDVLVYEAPMLRGITARESPIIVVHGDAIRTTLQLDRASYVDFALLLGTDFSQRIKNVGPNRALKFIREHGSIERVVEQEVKYPPRVPAADYLAQVGVARLVFQNLPPLPDVGLLHQGEVDSETVSEIIQRYRLQRMLPGAWDAQSALMGNYFGDDPSVW